MPATSAANGPSIEDFLGDEKGQPAEILLREMIRIDIFHRRRCRDLPRPADYRKRFADVSENWLAGEIDDAPPDASRVDQARTSVGPVPNGADRLLHADLVIPGYTLQGELGRGGMGVVFKAWQKSLDRFVALKLINAGPLASARALARFRTEALAAARLQHPHVVAIHEIGEFEGRPYLALEYVDGSNLARGLGGRPQPVRTAAQFVALLAETMHFAHERSIVHRDLKPSNILLAGASPQTGMALNGDSGRFYLPKVTDFGLAKLLCEEGGQTWTDDFLGTPSYMAPEQTCGQTTVTPAVDIYALGAILYEMLTGRPPFRAQTAMETVLQVRFEEPLAPRRLQPNVPLDIETICLKCLRKEPRLRYAHAGALAEDLRLFLAQQPIRARPVSTTERAYRWFRRRPAVAALGGSVAVLFLMLSVGAPLAALLLRQQRDEAQENARRAQIAEHDIRDKLWHSYLLEAKSVSLGRSIGQRFHGLDVLRRAVALRYSLELRNQAITCMALTDVDVVHFKKAAIPPGLDIDVDPRLGRYAVPEAGGDLVIRSVADDRELARLQGPRERPWYVLPLFSPDGGFLAANYYIANGRDRCLAWDLSTGTLVLEARIRGEGACLDFSLDSHWLATSQPDGAVGVYGLASEKTTRRIDLKDAGTTQVAFHPDGRQLAVSSGKMVRIVDIEGGKVKITLPQPARAHPVAWRGDGRLLAVGCDDSRTYIWDTTTWQEQAVLEGHDAGLYRLSFSHAGNLLATKSWDGTTKLWDPVSGRQLVSAPGSLVRFSQDDHRMAFAQDARVGIWELADGRECRALHHGRIGNRIGSQEFIGPWSVDFSPDGRLLASAGGDGVRLWDVAAGEEIAHLPVGVAEAALFHPRDSYLITYSPAGLFRWPMSANVERENSARPVSDRRDKGLAIGPPQLLAQPDLAGWARAAMSADGRWLAFVDHLKSKAVALCVEDAARKVQLGSHPGIMSVALSPDGRWVAAGAWGGSGVKVWATATGQSIKDLRVNDTGSNNAFVSFSPDGQWLVSGGQSDYRSWRTGSWEAGPVLERDPVGQGPGPLAFSSDSRVLAIAQSSQFVRLIDTSTFREIAQLQPPDPHTISCLAFSPDGSKLAAGTAKHVIHLWDLALIRRQLADMQLDWDLPLCETTPEHASLSMNVRAGDLSKWVHTAELKHAGTLHAQEANAHYQAGRWEKACVAYAKAAELTPDDAEAANNYAWLLVTCPNSELRNPRRAIELARNATRREPAKGSYWNTLGVALYRMGEWRACIEAVEKSERLGGTNSFNSFFLAMANWRLGNREPARERFRQALLLMDKNRPQDDQLVRFRAEAEALLGMGLLGPGPRP
jgi:serine/threonine protein kinase/WD40 repeat protein